MINFLGETRYTVKELTQKMLEGENEFVMKYLKTLPKEECKDTRAKYVLKKDNNFTFHTKIQVDQKFRRNTEEKEKWNCWENEKA